ncbi:MAG: hypothetical protein IPK60_11920 [Sandaracinaceae bacterium]|nr:hypothetical protein [Sandaracinaceae bacterium]
MTLASFLRLGFYFVRQLVMRLFGRSAGLKKFQANYANDRLLPLSPSERAALPDFSRCIACGMCDAAFTGYARVNRAEFRGPSDLPLSYSRNLPDFDSLTRYVSNLKEGDLDVLEQVCPARIPFKRLVVFVETHAAALGAPPGEHLAVATGIATERRSAKV